VFSLVFLAWQTKAVSAFRIKKNPVPLIAPLYLFSGGPYPVMGSANGQ
jgi:hypothetical protein